jgi:hypothetical protein
MIMDYIHGSTAFDQSMALGDPMRVPDEYQAHFFAQVSRIMVELASIRFPAIGSVLKVDKSADHGQIGDEEGLHSEFTTGLCADTYTGPYSNSSDFYNSYPAALAAKLNLHKPEQSSPEPVGSGIARVLKQLQSAQVNSETEGFSLVNLELGTHNILVDASYTIVSVIDWDSTFALPEAASYMFPFCSGAEPGVPGATVEVSPICPPLNDQRRGICNAFTRAFADALKTQLQSQTRSTSTRTMPSRLTSSLTADNGSAGGGFWSKEALAFRCLMFLKAKQDWVDDAWVPGLQWLTDHSDEDVRRAYALS